MGFYIQAPQNHNKADYFRKEHGAKTIFPADIPTLLDEGIGIVCVVDNQIFEAAAFCYNISEFEAFSDPTDKRPKQWLTMDRAWLEQESGYAQEMAEREISEQNRTASG